MKRPMRAVARAHITITAVVAQAARLKAGSGKILEYRIRMEILLKLRLRAQRIWIARRNCKSHRSGTGNHLNNGDTFLKENGDGLCPVSLRDLGEVEANAANKNT
jgi:hypothetical protein